MTRPAIYAAVCLMLAMPAHAETTVVPPCGSMPGTTTGAYSGVVTLTVSGLMVNAPGYPLQDGFYTVDPNDTTMSAGACPGCFRYNRASEGTCLCSYECQSTSHQVS